MLSAWQTFLTSGDLQGTSTVTVAVAGAVVVSVVVVFVDVSIVGVDGGKHFPHRAGHAALTTTESGSKAKQLSKENLVQRKISSLWSSLQGGTIFGQSPKATSCSFVTAPVMHVP